MKEAGARAQEESQRKSRGLEKKAQSESEQRANNPTVKAPEESQQNADGLEKKAQRVSEPAAQRRPAASEKGATKLSNKDLKKKGKEKPAPPDDAPVTPPASP